MSLKIIGGFSPTGRINVKLPYVLPTVITSVSTTGVTAASATLVFVLTPNTTYQYSLNNGPWVTLPADRTILNLSSSTTYQVRVRGVNRYGFGSASAPLGVTTLSGIATFDPLKRGSGITLSNNNLTATNSASTWRTVAGTNGQLSSNASVAKPWYVELNVSSLNIRVGLVDSNVSFNGNFIDQGYPGYSPYDTILYQGVSTISSSLNRATNGSIVGIEWDGRNVQFYLNGTPAVTSLSTTAKMPAGRTVFPAASIDGSGTIRANFGPNFVYKKANNIPW